VTTEEHYSEITVITAVTKPTKIRQKALIRLGPENSQVSECCQDALVRTAKLKGIGGSRGAFKRLSPNALIKRSKS